mmetsp:Transcript_8720/g.9905  ORF Transcript_8720/g.9905 Transcript_8720/m.9905 type:complete len:94 (+) Transcript_8720:295-576(+)
METTHLHNFKIEEDNRANDFIDYQNPYLFLEFSSKAVREQYDEHQALFPSVDDLQQDLTHKIQTNKDLKNLKFKLWVKEMSDKLKDRINKEEK